MLYQIHQGSVTLGGKRILDHIDFHIKGSEKIALVGRNGSGKTTLLRLIAGEIDQDRDDKRQGPGVFLARDTTIGLLSQSAFTKDELEKSVEDLIMDLCPSKDPYSREYYSYLVKYHRVFTGLGFSLKDSSRQIASFSGGEQTRIALIGLLLAQPDILLLDEPTNHLDLPAIGWLEDYLLTYPKAVVVVSHDRYFLDRTVHVIWELEHGRLTRYAGNYTHYRSERRKKREIQEKKYQAQQEEIARLTALIEKYKHKPSKASMARSKRKYLEHMDKVEKPREDHVHFFTEEIRPKEPGSKRVLEADKLKIGYDFPIKEISLLVRRGQKIGIIGENGTGKTTFLKTLAAIIPSLSGKLISGTGIKMGYFDQQTVRASSKERVYEHFSKHFPDMPMGDVKKLLGHYLFSGDETGKRLCDLSGGEISRLYLAELLTAGPNLLLLDEPTNHMDIPAKETLESAFMAYTGTMLFISHDRYFVKQLATSLLIFEKDRVLYYPFGYDHYQEYLRKEDKGGGAVVEAENTRIVKELHAVPDRKRMQASRFNTDQSYTDWQLSLAEKGLESCRLKIIRLLKEEEDRAKTLEGYMAGPDKEWEEAFEKEMTDYQQACLFWYDKYLDYKEAFASYRE